MDEFFNETSNFQSALNSVINCTLLHGDNSTLLSSTISPATESLINKTDTILLQFQQFYDPIHGYLSLAVCFFGTITNILNIIVLTR